jgi:shikimate dehydrogenase
VGPLADGPADAIADLRGDDFLGANVTIPHKERVVPMVDRLTDDAHLTGAVNTLTARASG